MIAVKAAAAADNEARALALVEPPPDGEATESEASDPRLRGEAARLSAAIGRYRQARAALAGINDPFAEAEITALELAERGLTSEAIAAWEAAFSAAADDADALAAAMTLAELGAPVPDLSNLERTNPEAVREIRVVQRAIAAGGSSLEALRAGASESLILTLKLAERYRDRGEFRMAADVLKAGAERWTQPQMMLMAARHLKNAGDLEAASRTVESALTMGGPGWAAQFSARVLLFEIHNDSGDWEQATNQARALVTLEPLDPDARWALVYSLVRRGDLPAAWSALTPEGEPVPPRNRQDAMTWIGLAAKYDSSAQFVSRALETMGRWPDDQQLIGIFIAQLYAGLRRNELSPTAEDLAALHEATADYTRRFPDSTVFRAVSVPEDDPLAPFVPDLRARYEALNEISAKVRNGELPLGLLAEAAGVSYAEVAIQRGGGFVRCHQPLQEGQNPAIVAAALDRAVVIDTTAANTLTLLDDSMRAHLLAVFGQTLATDAAYRDALRGHEALSLRSTMSVSWDPIMAGQPRVTTIDTDVADAFADRAELLTAVLRNATRRPWPELRTLDELPGQSGWLTSLDMAATDRLPFWCDDAVLRTLAASMGVPSFDTVDLLRHLAAQGRIARDLLRVSEATLVYHYYTDLGFDRATFDLAATMDDWRPRGAAFALTRTTAWANPTAVVEFVFAALGHHPGPALDDIEGWVSATASGLVRVAPDETAAGMNLQALLGQCVAQPWMRPDRLPIVLRAIRNAKDERPGTADPVEPVPTGAS